MPRRSEGARAVSSPGAEVRSGLAALSQALIAQGRVTTGDDLTSAIGRVAVALRDLGEVGRALEKPRPWWRQIHGGGSSIPDFLRALDEAAVEIDRLAEALCQERDRLSAALVTLEALRGQAARLADLLDEEIAAEEGCLGELDSASPGDFSSRHDRERQLHDLRLTRTVLEGSALSIQSMMDATAMLARRVTTMLCTALPAWELQTAHLVAAARAAPGQTLSSVDLGALQAASVELLASVADGSA